MNRRGTTGGFTLVEVLIAILITAMVMVSVATTFISTLQAQREVSALTESTEAGSRILNLLERDLRGLWTYNIAKNRVLIGRNMDIAGPPADRIDFLTGTTSISSILDAKEEPARTPVCEVGYWLRSNDRDNLLMELYRREDPMVDDDLLQGGTFQLVHDRLRTFNITYYKTLGNNAEEFHEWDSSTDDSLPRVIKVEFTIERKLSSSNQVRNLEVEDFEANNKRYIRYIVLEKEYMEILKPAIALIPVLPPEPKGGAEGSGEGGAGKNGPGALGGGGPLGAGTRQQNRGMRTPGAGGDGATTTTEGLGPPGGGRGLMPPGGPPRGLPPGFPMPGSGQVDLNQLFRQFGGR